MLRSVVCVNSRFRYVVSWEVLQKIKSYNQNILIFKNDKLVSQFYMLEFCSFHSGEADFPNIQFKNSTLPMGEYPCCGETALRFQPLFQVQCVMCGMGNGYQGVRYGVSGGRGIQV